MTRRLSKRDRAIVGALVERYTPAQIKKAIDAAFPSPGKIGRPRQNIGNAGVVWCAVEMRRSRENLPPWGILPACRFLARDLKQRVKPALSVHRLRSLHREAEQRRSNDQTFTRLTDDMLAELKQRAARLPDALVLPVPTHGSHNDKPVLILAILHGKISAQ